MLLQWFVAPFVIARVGEKVEGNLVSALVVVADESPDEHIAAQTFMQLADFLLGRYGLLPDRHG